MNGFSLGLGLKRELRVTRKWAIEKNAGDDSRASRLNLPPASTTLACSTSLCAKQTNYHRLTILCLSSVLCFYNGCIGYRTGLSEGFKTD